MDPILLLLLMLWIIANHEQMAIAFYNLAFVAHLFDC
jgi:hypothetical protein